MHFSRESLQDNIIEAESLLKEHWGEIAHYKDIPLDPNYDEYINLENAGIVRCFVARSGRDNSMVGYGVYFVRHNLHYRNSLQAVQDIIFIKKEHRGKGGAFLFWCDEQLKNEGVQAVYHHVKTEHNFGPVLERMSYELVDLIYARRLDK